MIKLGRINGMILPDYPAFSGKACRIRKNRSGPTLLLNYMEQKNYRRSFEMILCILLSMTFVSQTVNQFWFQVVLPPTDCGLLCFVFYICSLPHLLPIHLPGIWKSCQNWILQVYIHIIYFLMNKKCHLTRVYINTFTTNYIQQKNILQ